MLYDLAVIGGGILGLTSAYEYCTRYPDRTVIVLEKESTLASHQTGHNSGVIHSGIYYKPGSQKALTCTVGIKKLTDFAKRFNIPYETCGKLIVATDESELNRLDTLYKRGEENGLTGLSLIDGFDIKNYEPHVQGIKAIHVPETGIIDYGKVVETLAKEFQAQGGEILLNTEVLGLVQSQTNIIITRDHIEIHAKSVLNCAGLFSDKIASMTETELDIQIIPFRGEYYTVKEEKRHLVNNLIYPVPDPRFPFLGVHFTRRITGEIEAGPNAVLALAREGYKKTDIVLKDIVDMARFPGSWHMAKKYWFTGLGEQWRSFVKPAFVKALQHLIPEITSDDLIPGGSGVRAQAVMKNGQLVDDFFFIKKENILHVLNAPSPAATASFAIAEQIVNQIEN
ncbi:MAG: L-2-hydroxyglutarate oxidase [Candidatus Marinimicrobia bacterium]|nr:L-2-hydroxyglutarate oxidase [Candidatus Neomarinimicrobiota bacterium]